MASSLLTESANALSSTSLETIKREKVENEKLRMLLVDCEDSFVRLQQQVSAARRFRELYHAVEREKVLLHDFEKGFHIEHTRMYDPTRYFTEASQVLSLNKLFRSEMKPELSSLTRVSQSLKAMRGSIAGQVTNSSVEGKGSSTSAGGNTNSSSTQCNGMMVVNTAGSSSSSTTYPSAASSSLIMECIQKYVDKCITLLKDSKLDSQKWGPMLDPISVLLYDVAKQPPLASCMEEIEEQCRRYKYDVDELGEQQRQAVSEGDMRRAEELYYQQLAVLETYSVYQSKKIDTLGQEESSVFREPLMRVHEVHKRCSADVAALIREFEELKQSAEKDLFSLHAVRERRTGEDYNRQQQFIAARDLSNQALRENIQHHEAALQRIDAAEKEIIQLSIERKEEMNRRRALIEAEERRRIDMKHFLTFANQHTALLEETIHNCEVAEEVTDTIDEAISNACKDLEQHIRQVERDFESLRQEVHLGNLEGFRSFYLTLGDLLYKKERNVEELDKKIQMAHMQQELAMETLNPKAKEFSQIKKDLIKIREEMSSQITALRDRQTLCIDECRPTEEALRIAGIPFVSPVEELMEKNRARDIKLLEYHELMANEAGPGRSPKDEIVPATDEELRRDQEELERLRATIQPRKPNTASSTSRSLFKTM